MHGGKVHKWTDLQCTNVFCLVVKYKIQRHFHEILVITMYDHGYIISQLDFIQQFPQQKGFTCNFR